MSGGGGIGQLLPVALAVGATIATDGAAAPMLGEALGAEAGTVGASMLGAGALGAGSTALGGIVSGQSGSDILKNSLISGGVGAATAGLLGGTGGPNAGTLNSSATPSTVANDFAGSTPISAPPAAGSPVLDSYLANDTATQNLINNQAIGNPTVLSGSTPQSITGQPLTADANSGFLDKAYNVNNATRLQKYAPALLGGLSGSNIFAQPGLQGVTPPAYTGPLSKYKFDPTKYQPVMSPAFGYGPTSNMAEGGIAALAMGGQPGQNYPMAQQDHTVFATPNQMPTSAMAVRNFEPATNPLTGETSQPMAMGGIASIPRYNGQQDLSLIHI